MRNPAAVALGALGGRKRSKKKADAARKNGKQGGRPRTKVDAIVRVLEANGGAANLQTIYQQIGRYYKGAKASTEWSAGIRGVLYREIRNGKTFKKLDAATYALA